ALLVISVVGVYMKRFDWPRPALLVGFVLSAGLESSIYQTTQVYGFTVLYRPQSIFIAGLVLLSAVFAVRVIMQRRQAGDAARGQVATRVPQIAFTGILAAAVLYAVISVSQLIYLSRLFPVSVAVATLLFLGAVLLAQIY